EGAQGIEHREGAFGGVLASREGEHVGAALALAIDVYPAHLIHQRIDQATDLVRVGAEDAHLLAVLGTDDVLEGRLDVLERQRWPLKDRVPSRHSFTASSTSASGRMIAAFLASSPSTARSRWAFGCCFFRWSATLLDPIKVSTLIFPEFNMYGTTSEPRPYTV